MKGKSTDNLPLCDAHELHEDALLMAEANRPDGDKLSSIAEFFSIFADKTRLSILFAIEHQPLCVCDIAELLSTTKSAVSHQLKILRQADLVRYEKKGKNVFYRLADRHIRDIIDISLEHLEE